MAAQDDETTLAELCKRLAEVFAPPFDAQRSSLAVVSSNAGARSAVEFWSQAQRVGLAVASPALFPWTLANAACGRIAREFGVRGPNYTFTGRAAALSAALEQLADDLRIGRVTTGWIVAIDFASVSSPQTHFACVRSDDAERARRLAGANAEHEGSAELSSAVLQRVSSR